MLLAIASLLLLPIINTEPYFLVMDFLDLCGEWDKSRRTLRKWMKKYLLPEALSWGYVR